MKFEFVFNIKKQQLIRYREGGNTLYKHFKPKKICKWDFVMIEYYNKKKCNYMVWLIHSLDWIVHGQIQRYLTHSGKKVT